jgi:hypothetical protein
MKKNQRRSLIYHIGNEKQAREEVSFITLGMKNKPEKKSHLSHWE